MSSSLGQPSRCSAQTCFRVAGAGGIVKQDAPLRFRPDRIGAAAARAFDMEKKTARRSRSHDNRFVKGDLSRVKLVARAKALADVRPQLVESGKCSTARVHE